MASNKHFFQDRTALLLVSGNSFLALAAVVLVALKLGAVRGASDYIISYRATLGIDHYGKGTVWNILAFIVATALMYLMGLALAYRVYAIKRELSLVVLACTTILLSFIIVVSNALLVLQ